MQCGGNEVYFVKQQPVPCDEEQGFVSYEANSILIANSLASYLANGYTGLFMPCPYIRKKDAGQVESGIAYYGFPSPCGHESKDSPFGTMFDRDFGNGFTTMLVTFVHGLRNSSRDTGISLSDVIGVDIRPRLHLGSLALSFMLVGPHIICLKTHVSERDFVWTVLRDTGITEVFHMPSVTAAINEASLFHCKPNRIA